MSTITRTPEVETPIEERKPMKLSEAMRLGSLGTLQSFRRWHEIAPDGSHKMCALSTAWYALTGETQHDAERSQLQKMLGRVIVTNPDTQTPMHLDAAIIALNDASRWDRQRIADWLESIGL